ncbi:probable ATP-dependent RNA helicase DHX35 [Ctenocephalides felis]|uniref:probable ATP-dependent RNA helicase DHX35 n=1 Tax=Ctenocephalides felis TaxID=7515 RepID=UPI000E6E4634|nr:probable ATP-dependent RNA helicase DHX35 [Ctenocephalides felis]
MREKYLLEAGWAKKGMIGVTQPRRVAAVSLATRVAEERDVALGDEIGYAVRFDDCTSDKTAIKFMTEGILLREMLASPLLTQYSIIIVDEAHERNMLTDMVLGLLKKILKKRKSLHLVISSATVDAEFLKTYFSDTNKLGDAATILGVQGRTFHVDVHYVEEPVPCYIKATADTVLKIHKSENPGDILCFLTGMDEVVQAKNILADHCLTKDYEDLIVLPMYGSLPNNDQLKVFFKTPRGKRKVILATNIAETSVTIPGIVYVVDCGYMKLKVFNPAAHVDNLVIVPISKANGVQRAGRAGRIQPGKVYR